MPSKPSKPSNLGRLSRRKNQTRLTFDPVAPTGSSPSASMSPANVRHQKPGNKTANTPSRPTRNKKAAEPASCTSSSKKPAPVAFESPRFLLKSKKKASQSSRALPTPAKSSQLTRSQAKVYETLAFSDSSDSSAGEAEEGEPGLPTTYRVAKVLFPGAPKGNQIIELSDLDDEEPVRSSPMKRKKSTVASESDEDDSDIVSSAPQRRRHVAQGDGEKEGDEEVELTALPARRRPQQLKSKKSAPSYSPSSARCRHRTEKEKTLELLKRKRAGEDIDKVTDSSESDDNNRRGLYDSDEDSELQALSEFEDEEESEVEIAKPKKVARAKKFIRGRDSDKDKDQDEYDSEFVIDDDEDTPLGVPLSLHDIPLEFTHQAHKPLKEHFRDMVEWMVHKKINPGFARDDPIYRQAFLKLDSEYAGYAKSKFVSSQWTAEFTRAICARPVLNHRSPLDKGEGITLEGVYKCDVCNHRKHIPSSGVSFSGKPYDIDTLEDLTDDSDESSDSDASSAGDTEKVDYDQSGSALPSENKEWLAGRTCYTNAEHAHTLLHWKRALNEWVVDHLEHTGELTPEKLAARDQMSSNKRMKYANKLVDRREKDGVIAGLYRDFKGQLEVAKYIQPSGRWESKRR
ncbi:hypothetical protein BJ878DRAFT_314871 [Calycina marina]|uniref:DUF4211 domain-containing protein n=1 Tax=Calycina marina TaxID=1763456 RepID=A0A9P8CGQ6_9HELO|nr:hypothetical protein BJ878DRAFT_314871 [Calycina marina]